MDRHSFLKTIGIGLASLVSAGPANLDGVSIMPLLKDPSAALKRNRLYWHYPLKKPHFLGGRSAGAVREGDWKLIEFFDTGDVELYNLNDDIGEQHNLAQKTPEKCNQLRKALAAWRREVGAEIPQAKQNVKQEQIKKPL